MKHYLLAATFLIPFTGSTQIIPDVSPDTLFIRTMPIVLKALKSGVYDLPRDTSWQHLQTYESGAFTMNLPARWLNLGGAGSVVEVAFDASGLYFPETYNNRPILAGVFVLNVEGSSLEELKQATLKQYRTNPDRIFPPGYIDTAEAITLPGGTQAMLLHTRFQRASNQLNQSRYDLLLFSEKIKKGYSIMLSVQYGDPTYNFETLNSLEAVAARIINNVSLKQ